jgi:hypothetical protein
MREREAAEVDAVARVIANRRPPMDDPTYYDDLPEGVREKYRETAKGVIDSIQERCPCYPGPCDFEEGIRWGRERLAEAIGEAAERVERDSWYSKGYGLGLRQAAHIVRNTTVDANA